MARRLSSPVFIGRSNELNALLSTGAAAASGQPMVTIVSGEAGVGKSRLVAEVGERLRDRGWLILEGGAVALGDDSLPFGPIVEALRALARDVDHDQIVAAAGPTLPELARLVPELSEIAGGSPVLVGQGEWLQTRIFEGVLRLLGRLGEASPILLVIENLQWSDRSTRDLLSFLARNARNERLLIVATIRSDEPHRQHPLTAWLAEADRQSRVERIDLSRFERDALVELLTGILGSAPSKSLVDSIARRSEGNAFFAEELLGAFHEKGHERLPETLREVLLVRMTAVSETARRLVEIAAVAGRQVDHDVLADVCGLSEVELRLALHEAVDAQLLTVDVHEPMERYAFRHALAQEAAYDELLPSERRAVHAAYARRIENRSAAGGTAEASRLVELAFHWTAAREASPALAAAIKAGDASRAVYAFGEAGRQYEHAIASWDTVPAADRPTDRDLADLYGAASAAARMVGDYSRAVDLARRAVELIDASAGLDGDRERRALAREQLGEASWLAGDAMTSLGLLQEAVDLLDGSEPSIGQARVLAGLAAELLQVGRLDEAVLVAERAIQCARTIREPGIESRALRTLGVLVTVRGNIAGGIELLRRCLDIAIREDDPTVIPWVYLSLAFALASGGLVEEALGVSLAGAEHSRRFGVDITGLEDNEAGYLIDLGRYAEAAELLERLVAHARPGRSSHGLHFTRAQLAVRTGDLPAARRELEIARSEADRFASVPMITRLHACGSDVALWDGDPSAALSIAREGFDRLVEFGDSFLFADLVIPATQAAADLAVRARAARDPAGADAAVNAARDVIERYRASTERLTDPDSLADHEIGWRMALYAAELGRAEGDDDPANWDAVRPALTAQPAPFLEAYVLWRKAEALAGRGESKAAGQPLQEAHAIAVAIGALLLVALIEAFGRRARIDIKPADVLTPPEVGTAGNAEPSPPLAPTDPFGLTRREREVLALVAEGYSNRRIAETLFISESTAGVHVSHILGKLEAESRTEAATVAVRLGLDRAPTAS